MDRVASSRLNAPKLIKATDAQMCAQAIASSSCQLPVGGGGGGGAQACDAIFGHAECRAQDPENFARPSGWQLARTLESTPATLDLQLCESQSQWFAIDMSAGQRLSARLTARPPGTVRIRLYAPNSAPQDRVDQRNEMDQLSLDDRWTQLSEAPMSGRYFIELENGLTSAAAQVELTLE